MYFAPPWMFDSVTVMSPTLSDCPVAGMSCITPIAPTGLFLLLVERRLLVALRGQHQRVEVVLLAVFLEERNRLLEPLVVGVRTRIVQRLDRLHVLLLPIRHDALLLDPVRIEIVQHGGELRAVLADRPAFFRRLPQHDVVVHDELRQHLLPTSSLSSRRRPSPAAVPHSSSRACPRPRARRGRERRCSRACRPARNRSLTAIDALRSSSTPCARARVLPDRSSTDAIGRRRRAGDDDSRR